MKRKFEDTKKKKNKEESKGKIMKCKLIKK